MFDNASPAGIRVNTIVLAFTLVAGTVVFLRIFTRLVLTKGAGFEDVCIAFAMVCCSSWIVDTTLTNEAAVDCFDRLNFRGSHAWPWKARRRPLC